LTESSEAAPSEKASTGRGVAVLAALAVFAAAIGGLVWWTFLTRDTGPEGGGYPCTARCLRMAMTWLPD